MGVKILFVINMCISIFLSLAVFLYTYFQVESRLNALEIKVSNIEKLSQETHDNIAKTILQTAQTSVAAEFDVAKKKFEQFLAYIF